MRQKTKDKAKRKRRKANNMHSKQGRIFAGRKAVKFIEKNFRKMREMNSRFASLHIAFLH